MEHKKFLQYQIRCTNNETGEQEKYAIDWGVSITHLNGCDIVNFTKADGNPGAFMIKPECTIEIGFFEVEY